MNVTALRSGMTRFASPPACCTGGAAATPPASCAARPPIDAGPMSRAMHTASTMGRVRRNAFSINFIGCVVLWVSRGTGGRRQKKRPCNSSWALHFAGSRNDTSRGRCWLDAERASATHARATRVSDTRADGASELVRDLRLHANRLAVRRRPRPETGALQHIVETFVVTAVTRRRELEVEHLPRLVDIEFGDEMETFELCRIRQWNDEKLDDRRRIVLLHAATRSGTGARPTTGADTGTNTTSTARPTAVAAIATRTAAGARRGCRRFRRRRLRLRLRLHLGGWRRLWRLDLRRLHLGRLGLWDRRWRGNHRSRCGRRRRCGAHVCDALLGTAGPALPASTTAGRTKGAGALRLLDNDARVRYRRPDDQHDHEDVQRDGDRAGESPIIPRSRKAGRRQAPLTAARRKRAGRL